MDDAKSQIQELRVQSLQRLVAAGFVRHNVTLDHVVSSEIVRKEVNAALRRLSMTQHASHAVAMQSSLYESTAIPIPWWKRWAASCFRGKE